MTIDPIKPYIGLIKAAAVVVAVVGAMWWWNSFVDRQQDIGYQRAAGEYAAKLAKEKEVALVTERGWRKQLEIANHDRIETEKRLDGYRAASLVADDRLRRTAGDFGKRLSAATAEACRHAAETAAGLLGECSAAYRDVAAAAGGHLADVEQCEAAWPE